MQTLLPDCERARLIELKHFLRARRASLRPVDVGLEPGQRRKTPGLRRDEVARLAGIGTTWYTFLEQGRNVRASTKVLDRLSDVFGLNATERRYFYQLAQGTIPEDRPVSGDDIMVHLRQILAQFEPYPAYVLDHRFDMIAWNAVVPLVFDYSEQTPPPQRNLIRRLFRDPLKRHLQGENFELQARSTLAVFRPHFSRHADDPVLVDLVRELEAVCPDFKKWWSQHEVLEGQPDFRMHLHHRTLGSLHGRLTFLSVFGYSNLTLCVFTPDAETDTEETLRRGLASPN